MGLKGRHIVEIGDLTRAEMELVFRCAERLAAQPRGHLHLARGFQLATLFFEPSTRTRLSFESAMQRLGGAVLTVADAAQSSAAKGETLADTARIVGGYADIIVLRHPAEGAARLAADVAGVPVINAGDGAHEHPTQTLCDLYTLGRERGPIASLTVILYGDLKYGRTVHSLACGLAEFGARVVFAPADPALAPPPALVERLRERWGCMPEWWDPRGGTPFPDADALYLTRVQRERFAGADDTGILRALAPIDAATLAGWGVGPDTLLLHPLPRAGDLDPALDGDPRSAYFRQAGNGVPVRMALLALLLGVAEEEWANGWGAPRRHTAPLPTDAAPGAAVSLAHNGFRAAGIVCPNAACIANRERATVEQRFVLPTAGAAREPAGAGRHLGLCCRYCAQPVSVPGALDRAANVYRHAGDPRLLALLSEAGPDAVLLSAPPADQEEALLAAPLGATA